MATSTPKTTMPSGLDARNFNERKKYPIKDIIEYTVALINEFALFCGLTETQAYRYIRNHEGIEFIHSNYGIMHTLDFRDAIEGVSNFCKRKGGLL